MLFRSRRHLAHPSINYIQAPMPEIPCMTAQACTCGHTPTNTNGYLPTTQTSVATLTVVPTPQAPMMPSNLHMACMLAFTTPLSSPPEPPSPLLPSPFTSAGVTTKNVAHLQPGHHVPMLVVHGNKTYHVLLLSPPLQMPFDHILPLQDAFCAAGTPAPSYPIFETNHCTWQAIFSMIAHPELLWDCWAPKSLGSYMSIKLLWEA